MEIINQKEYFQVLKKEQALENKSISLHSKIISIFKTVNEDGNDIVEKYTSTAGRFLLANVLQKP